ncbi:MAG: hypothetical protein Kow0037_30800 [Calditrichia bacterium]
MFNSNQNISNFFKKNLEKLKSMAAQHSDEEWLQRAVEFAKTHGGEIAEKLMRLVKTYRSGELSRQQKILIILAIVYTLWPVDMVPDMTPVIGFLDDIAVIGMILNQLFKGTPVDENSVDG